MKTLRHKVAVITGGTSGIGYATGKEFSALGARVVITGLTEETLKNAAAELNVMGVVSDQGILRTLTNWSGKS